MGATYVPWVSVHFFWGGAVELFVSFKMVFAVDFVSLHLPEGVSCVKLHLVLLLIEILKSLVAYNHVNMTLWKGAASTVSIDGVQSVAVHIIAAV